MWAGIVDVAGRFLGVAAIGFAKQVAGDPFGVFAQDLVIDVFEQVELNRFAGPIGRLDAVDHDPPHAADEIAVEKGDRGPQPGVQLGLPVAPVVPVQIAPRHAPAVVVEDVQVVEVVGRLRVPSSQRHTEWLRQKIVQIHRPLGIHRRQPPIEHSPGIFGVALRIAAAAAIEDDAAVAFLLLAGMGKLQTELRLADARRADDDRERAGNQPAAEQLIEAGNAGRLARIGWDSNAARLD